MHRHPLICYIMTCAGKSALAARLAKAYGLRHISAKDALSEAGLACADAELQKAVAAELAGKEPRVSAKNITALMQRYGVTFHVPGRSALSHPPVCTPALRPQPSLPPSLPPSIPPIRPPPTAFSPPARCGTAAMCSTASPRQLPRLNLHS